MCVDEIVERLKAVVKHEVSKVKGITPPSTPPRDAPPRIEAVYENLMSRKKLIDGLHSQKKRLSAYLVKQAASLPPSYSAAMSEEMKQTQADIESTQKEIEEIDKQIAEEEKMYSAGMDVYHSRLKRYEEEVSASASSVVKK